MFIIISKPHIGFLKAFTVSLLSPFGRGYNLTFEHLFTPPPPNDDCWNVLWKLDQCFLRRRCFRILSPFREGCARPIGQTQILYSQEFFVPKLVEHCSLFLEKVMCKNYKLQTADDQKYRISGYLRVMFCPRILV